MHWLTLHMQYTWNLYIQRACRFQNYTFSFSNGHHQILKQLRISDMLNCIQAFNLVKQFSLLFSTANPPLRHIDGYFFPMPCTCCTILFVFGQWRNQQSSSEGVHWSQQRQCQPPTAVCILNALKPTGAYVKSSGCSLQLNVSFSSSSVCYFHFALTQ